MAPGILLHEPEATTDTGRGWGDNEREVRESDERGRRRLPKGCSEHADHHGEGGGPELGLKEREKTGDRHVPDSSNGLSPSDSPHISGLVESLVNPPPPLHSGPEDTTLGAPGLYDCIEGYAGVGLHPAASVKRAAHAVSFRRPFCI